MVVLLGEPLSWSFDMANIIKFNQDDEKPQELNESQESQQSQELPKFLQDLREFVLSYYPNTISDILGFSGFIKNDNPYVFVGYVAWQDNGSNQYITPLIAMFNNIDKRFAFLNAKNHYFDPQVLKTDIQKLGIDINQIYKALE